MSDVPKSGHGGSRPSGLVLPAGMGELQQLDGSQMFEPPEVTAAKKMAAERAARALQLERRRIALEIIPAVLQFGPMGEVGFGHGKDCTGLVVSDALAVADELIAKTGGGI